MVIAPNATESVTGNRLAISLPTVRWLKKESPRSPCAAAPSHSPYCSTNGLSSRSFFRARSTPAGVAF